MSTLLPLATIDNVGGIKPKQGSGVVVDTSGVVTLSYDPYLKLDLRGTSGNASATGADAIAIGSGALASHDRSVAIGIGAQTAEPDSFSVGTSSSLRRIKGVKDGVDPTDATSLGQVKSMLQGVSGQGGLYLSGTIPGTLTNSNKPLLAWLAPRAFTLAKNLVKVSSVRTPSGSNLVLNLMYRDPTQGAQDIPIGLISYYGMWAVSLGVSQNVLEGGMLSVIDTGSGDPGFLSIGISIPAS